MLQPGLQFGVLRFLFMCLIAWAAATPVGSAQADPQALAGPLPAEVVRVIDGDTIDVRVAIWLNQVLTVRVRLLGLDAPELRGRCPQERERAAEARTRLGELVAGNTVHLRDVQHDKYGGRVQARVETVQGFDIAATLIAEGLARAYDGGRRSSWCKTAQESTRSALPRS